MDSLVQRLRQQWPIILLFVALLVTSQIQKQASEKSIRLADERAAAACVSANKTVREINLRTDAFLSVRDSLGLLVVQIRKSRSNKTGSSFSPQFVREIDRNITPSLQRITPRPVEKPKC